MAEAGSTAPPPSTAAPSPALDAETERRYLAEQLRTLLDRAPLGIYLVDADFRMVQLNPVAQRAFGGVPGGTVGRDFEAVLRIVWPAPLVDDVVAIFRRTLATGEPYRQQALRELRADRGVVECYDWQVERLTLPDGRHGVVCYFRDVGEELRTHDALVESEARFREMADHAPVMVWLTGPDHRCTYLSRSWYEFTGQDEGAGTGNGWLDAVHPDDRETVEQLFLEAADARRDVSLEYRLASRTGEYRWMLDSAAPRRGPTGDFLGYLGSVLDITERKRSEQQLRANRDTFFHLIENNPFGVYLVDADFRLIQVSRGAQKTFETVRPLHGRDFAEVLRILWVEPFATDAIERFRHTLATGEPYVQPSTVEQRADLGVVESYDWRIERITLPDGRYGVVCYFYDLSERQALEAALRQSEQSLREQDRRKDEFLATLAHELRNPLAPLRTAAHVLRSGELADAQRDAARAMIERQVATMTRLVDDLLEVSRLTLGRIELQCEPVSLAVAVDQALEAAQPAIAAGRHRLEVDVPRPPPWVSADVTRLAQVFANLLANAAKYTPPGGTITLEVRAEQGQAVIRVRDTGIGIPADMVDRVFEMFTQIPKSGTMAQGGLGIGLALARRLVEMHGGAVTARSAGEGHGSEFCVRLPLVAAPAAHAGPDAAAAGAVADRRRVLVVDDNIDAAESLAMLLAMEGHEVRTAHTGEAALETLGAEPYDVVLLDIGLPGRDGYEVARVARQQLGSTTPLLIALTGWGQEADRRRATEAGFDHHLTKPAEPAVLARLITAREGARPMH